MIGTPDPVQGIGETRHRKSRLYTIVTVLLLWSEGSQHPSCRYTFVYFVNLVTDRGEKCHTPQRSVSLLDSVSLVVQPGQDHGV